MNPITLRLLKQAGLWFVFLLVCGALYALLFMRQGDRGQESAHQPLVLEHSFVDGTHTYTGVREVAGCRNLGARYTVVGGPSPSVSVELATLPETFCPEQESGVRTIAFGVGGEASSSPQISALLLDGKPLGFSVVEAGAARE